MADGLLGRSFDSGVTFPLTCGVIMHHNGVILTPNEVYSYMHDKNSQQKLLRQNLRLVKQLQPTLARTELSALRDLTCRFNLSVSLGEIVRIDCHWYITHSGLLRIATDQRCQGICTSLQRTQSDLATKRWVFRATVYKSSGARGFVGYGDADPSNVSPLVRGAEMRIAETRAVNRALRKAYGIGLCSVEELGWASKASEPPRSDPPKPLNVGSNGHHLGQPRLRDQLCLLIRQHNLDPNLVKAYAAHFCGTETIKEAGRDLVESFVSHLAASAKEDRDGLICKLNSFAPVTEVHQ